MQIIGDRHYRSEPAEPITFSVGVASRVGLVTVACSCELGNTLPLTVGGMGHRTVAITAGFTGADGGSVDIIVSGSSGGDTSKIRQLTGFPARTAIFIID